MSISLLVLGAALAAQSAQPAAAEPPEVAAVDAVRASAVMVKKPLGEDMTRRFSVTLEVAEGWSISSAGHATAFLQIDLPNSVELAGEILSDPKALASNGFLLAPFERAIEPGTTSIDFTMVARPQGEETIGLNFIAYPSRPDGGEAFFYRRRLELPVKVGAAAVEGDARDSSWGDPIADRDGLAIGERADPLTLPRADGSTVSLGEYIGKKNVIITTYRAFW